MKREDFIFDHMDDEYEDYWFKVVGDTKDELTKKYMEMCMVSVTEVVYSNEETEAQLYLHRPRLRPVYGKDDGYKIQLHRVQRMVWELYSVSRCC